MFGRGFFIFINRKQNHEAHILARRAAPLVVDEVLNDGLFSFLLSR